MSNSYQCWKCGVALETLILPMSRRETCQSCAADQHVCRMCRHFAPRTADQCDEERAEFVSDKEQANFCDYFSPNPNAYRPRSQDDATARAKLAELFGESPQDSDKQQAENSSADAAMEELKKLFGEDRE